MILLFCYQLLKLLISPGWIKILLTLSFGYCHLVDGWEGPLPPKRFPPVFWELFTSSVILPSAFLPEVMSEYPGIAISTSAIASREGYPSHF